MLSLLFFLVGTITSSCPRGSYHLAHRDTCVTIVANGSRHGYYEAQVECMWSRGGQLASVNNLVENAVLFALAKGEHLVGKVFLGAHVNNGSWKWSDRNSVQFTHWARGNPVEGDKCATMDLTDTKWYSEDCSKRNVPFFCEVPPRQKEKACPKTWTLFKGECYMFRDKFPKKLTWNEARNECKVSGGDLASITSEEENDMLEGLTESDDCNTTMVWIGLRIADGIEWSDGSLVVYSKIEKDTSYEDGVFYMYPACHEKAGLWARASKSNTTTTAFICKRPAVEQCHASYVPAR